MVLFGLSTTQINASTSTGVQTLAVDCEGHTPKAYVIESARVAASGGSPTDHANYFWGASDGSTEFAFSTRATDGGTATNDGSIRSGVAVLELINNMTNTSDASATHDSFDTDEIAIDWGSTPPGTAHPMNVVAFYGDLLEVDLVDHVHSNTGSDPNSVSGLSFAPNLVMSWSPQIGFPDPASGVPNWRLNHGFAYLDESGSIVQGHYASRTRSGVGINGAIGQVLRNDSISSHIDVNASGVPTYTGIVEVTSFNSDGITVEPSASGMSFAQALLMMNIGANRVALSFQDLETSTSGTGAAKKITTGWTPRYGRMVGTSIPV
jgi:hypothetical protein